MDSWCRAVLKLAICVVSLVTITAYADAERLADATESLSVAAFEPERPAYVSALVASGLDEETAHQNFTTLRRAMAICVLNAIQTYAEEEGLSFSAQLDALENAIASNVADEYLNSFDEARLRPLAEPCLQTAMAEAGLSL